MAGKKKPKAREAFDDTIDDAKRLALLANALCNARPKRARTELRNRVGVALRIPQKRRSEIDCVESSDLFVVIKPGSGVKRADVSDDALSPLLRQAYVVTCTAIETFVADRVMERVGRILRGDDPPARLRELPMSVGNWLDIEARYSRRQWGVRKVIENEIRQMASPAPTKVGEAFAVVGESNLLRRLDARRGVPRGTTTRELGALYERRNRITHTGDRDGRDRAAIAVADVLAAIDVAVEIVGALDEETRG